MTPTRSYQKPANSTKEGPSPAALPLVVNRLPVGYRLLSESLGNVKMHPQVVPVASHRHPPNDLPDHHDHSHQPNPSWPQRLTLSTTHISGRECKSSHCAPCPPNAETPFEAPTIQWPPVLFVDLTPKPQNPPPRPFPKAAQPDLAIRSVGTVAVI